MLVILDDEVDTNGVDVRRVVITVESPKVAAADSGAVVKLEVEDNTVGVDV